MRGYARNVAIWDVSSDVSVKTITQKMTVETSLSTANQNFLQLRKYWNAELHQWDIFCHILKSFFFLLNQDKLAANGLWAFLPFEECCKTIEHFKFVFDSVKCEVLSTSTEWGRFGESRKEKQKATMSSVRVCVRARLSPCVSLWKSAGLQRQWGKKGHTECSNLNRVLSMCVFVYHKWSPCSIFFHPLFEIRVISSKASALIKSVE